MFDRIKSIVKTVKTVNLIQKVIDERKLKFDELLAVIEKAKTISPEIKIIVKGLIDLFK